MMEILQWISIAMLLVIVVIQELLILKLEDKVSVVSEVQNVVLENLKRKGDFSMPSEIYRRKEN